MYNNNNNNFKYDYFFHKIEQERSYTSRNLSMQLAIIPTITTSVKHIFYFIYESYAKEYTVKRTIFY